MALKLEEISVFFNLFGILALSVISIFLFVCKSLYDKRRIFQFSRKLKGYTFFPIIGNGHHIMGKNFFVALQEIIQKFGTPCNAWFGHDYNYLTDDPNEIKIILNHPNSFDKNIVYDNFKLAFDHSLILAPSSLIGVDYDLQVKPQKELVEILGQLQRTVGNRMTSSYYFNEKIWFYTSEGKRCIHQLNTLKNIIYEILEERRKEFKETEAESLVDDKTLPLLDLMLKAENKEFNDDLIFREVFLFAGAATDTSGYTLAYTFTLLGMNPEVQEKVYEEVINTVGHDRQIYYDDLPNLKYTERAILEAMRILPVTPFVGRLATGDVDLGSRVLPKGANIILCAFNLQRNEKYWPDPLKYNPDRFLPEEAAKRHPYAFIPFSGGPRNCIGKTYAMMLMKTCVANVIRNYEVSSKYKSLTELKLVSCITMKTQDDLDCRFKLRKHK